MGIIKTPPDPRTTAINEAARVLRDAGCLTVSIMASWADSDTRTMLIMPQMAPVKRGLGRGLSAIRKSDARQDGAVGVLKRGKTI